LIRTGGRRVSGHLEKPWPLVDFMVADWLLMVRLVDSSF
jgi:hypothetical protein